jgi:hypothetical protein
MKSQQGKGRSTRRSISRRSNSSRKGKSRSKVSAIASPVWKRVVIWPRRLAAANCNASITRQAFGNRCCCSTLRTRVAWAHDWISDPTLAAVFQTLPGASFIVNGATPAKNSALTSAGAELRLANGVTLVGKFDGEFASHSSTYAGTGTVRYTW